MKATIKDEPLETSFFSHLGLQNCFRVLNFVVNVGHYNKLLIHSSYCIIDNMKYSNDFASQVKVHEDVALNWHFRQCTIRYNTCE